MGEKKAQAEKLQVDITNVAIFKSKTIIHVLLFQVLTTYAIQKRLQNVSITVSAQEPGYVKTELARGFSDKGVISFINKIGYNCTSHCSVLY